MREIKEIPISNIQASRPGHVIMSDQSFTVSSAYLTRNGEHSFLLFSHLSYSSSLWVLTKPIDIRKADANYDAWIGFLSRNFLLFLIFTTSDQTDQESNESVKRMTDASFNAWESFPLSEPCSCCDISWGRSIMRAYHSNRVSSSERIVRFCVTLIGAEGTYLKSDSSQNVQANVSWRSERLLSNRNDLTREHTVVVNVTDIHSDQRREDWIFRSWKPYSTRDIISHSAQTIKRFLCTFS